MRLDRKLPRIFYGWWIVGACFLIALYTGGVLGYGFTAIIDPLIREFGWSYAQVSLAVALRGMEVGFFAPAVGWFVDRYGARWVMFTGAIIVGLGLLLVSRVNSLVMFYGVWALVSLGSSTCGTTAIISVVSQWFHQKVSIATGITICGFGASGLMVLLVTRLIDTLGWRTAILTFGVGVFVITVPLTLVVRRRPEDYGYLPDGAVSSVTSEKKNTAPIKTDTSGITARQALKSRAFWHIAAVFTAQWMMASAVITHIMPYLSSLGIARAISSLLASAVPITSIFGRLGFGWLGDRMNKKLLTAIGFILMSLGLLFFGFAADEKWLLVLFLIPFSIGFGGINTMRGVLPREYFGRRSFATILGFIMEVGIVGSLTGAPLAGLVFDNWGSYQPIWFAYSGLAIIVLIVIATMPPFGQRAE